MGNNVSSVAGHQKATKAKLQQLLYAFTGAKAAFQGQQAL